MTTFEFKRNVQPNAERATTSLTAWGERKPLASVVLNIVRQVNERELRPVAASDASTAFQPRTLLALMTYCYATGIYGSQDMESVMRQDSVFRMLCGHEFPSWRTLRRFRRLNHDLIHPCLGETLHAARRTAPADPSGTSLGERGGQTLTGPARREMLNREESFAEAGQRIEKAMFIDSMTIED